MCKRDVAKCTHAQSSASLPKWVQDEDEYFTFCQVQARIQTSHLPYAEVAFLVAMERQTAHGDSLLSFVASRSPSRIHIRFLTPKGCSTRVTQECALFQKLSWETDGFNRVPAIYESIRLLIAFRMESGYMCDVLWDGAKLGLMSIMNEIAAVCATR